MAIRAAGLTLAVMLTAFGVDARTYTALELSVPPATAPTPTPMDDNAAVTHEVRGLLAQCLRTTSDRATCVAISVGHCPRDIQAYVCANSEYIVWTSYIGYYLEILYAAGQSSYMPALKQSQSAWQTYVEAQCDYVGRFWLDTEPRMRSMSVADCKRDEAGHRALGLRADILNLNTGQ